MRAAEEDLGLNREELRRRRWAAYETLRTLADVIEADTVAEAKTGAAAVLRAMLGGEREYTAMARYFISVEWQLDLPTRAQ